MKEKAPTEGKALVESENEDLRSKAVNQEKSASSKPPE